MAHDVHKLADDALWVRTPVPSAGYVRGSLTSVSGSGRGRLMLLAWLGVFAGPLVLLSLIALPVAIVASGTVLDDPVVQMVGGIVLGVHLVAVWTLLRAAGARERGRRLIVVDSEDAPVLHTLIADLARSLGAPAIQRVMIGTELNASVSQQPVMFGFGTPRHELVIGLPLLQSLAHDEFSAVLLHELAHSRRSDGRLHALVFRARQQWLRLEHATEDSRFVGRSILRRATQFYLRQLTTRARQVLRDGEYAADAVAANVMGPRVLARALVRITQARDGLGRLWDTYWLGNVLAPRPTRGPWATFTQALPGMHVDRRHEAYENSGGYHPSMAERLSRLGIVNIDSVDLAYPVAQPSICLLGTAADRVVRHFDTHWWQENQQRWATFYQGVSSQRVRLAALDRAAQTQDLSEATAIERAMRAEYLLGTDASIERYRWCLHHFPSSAVARYNLDQLLRHTSR